MVCGIDEAGRGPLAGPLCVAGVILKERVDGLDDSKKLSEKKREKLFEEIIKKSSYKIVFVDNLTIDSIGVSASLKSALKTILSALRADLYLFDGNCSFGVSGIKTLIKGDSLVDEIKAASILAKVSRDRYMKEIASSYPNYSFATHKGYGTKKHLEEIKRFGLSDVHRKSFCKRLNSLNNCSLDATIHDGCSKALQYDLFTSHLVR